MSAGEPTGPSSPAEREGAAPAAGVGMPPPPRTGLFAWMPGLWVLRNYRRAFFGHDVVAGIVLTTILVPAGMSYAEAAGLPAITGLYATIVPLLAYALFGPSRIMVMGPDSGLAALISGAVLVSAAGDPERAIALASLLAILTGLLCIGAGLAKVGFVTDLLSKPVRTGYMNGIALTVLVMQLPKLSGFSSSTTGAIDSGFGFVEGVIDGQANPTALGIGGACLLIIFGLRAIAPRAPGILIAVALATVTVSAFDLGGSIQVIGPVPRGMPLPSLPAIRFADIGQMFVGALGIALVSFADSSVLSRTFARRHGYHVDPNRELIGLGVANFASGCFRGFPISSSASRTPVAESAGSRTQVTGIVGALLITVLLIAAPRLLENLPTTALAAVVIAAAYGIFDFRALQVFRRVRRADFILSLVAFMAVAALGVIPGIALAVGISILDFVRRAWRPYDAILGRAESVKGYHDIGRYPGARQVPGLLLFRWDAPLFFANADMFRERVLDAVHAAAVPVQWVVIAAEPITDVDTTAADMLAELDEELHARGVELAFAEMKDPVKDRLQQYGLEAKIGNDLFFPTLGVAVKTFRERHGVVWTDWEDATKAKD